MTSSLKYHGQYIELKMKKIWFGLSLRLCWQSLSIDSGSSDDDQRVYTWYTLMAPPEVYFKGTSIHSKVYTLGYTKRPAPDPKQCLLVPKALACPLIQLEFSLINPVSEHKLSNRHKITNITGYSFLSTIKISNYWQIDTNWLINCM